MLRGHTADRGQENDRLSNSSVIKKAPGQFPGAFSSWGLFVVAIDVGSSASVILRYKAGDNKLGMANIEIG